MTRVEMIEDIIKALTGLDEKNYNAFEGNIFEVATYLYLRYGELPYELLDEDKLEKVGKIIKKQDTLFNGEINYDVEELMEEKTLKQVVIDKLYDFWSTNDTDKVQLFKEITDNVNDGKDGAETLLDWCRISYDGVQDTYRNNHDLTEEEMFEVMEENSGNYEFMYDEIPYVSWLDEVWDLCNWWLDYVNGQMTEEDLLKLID